MKKTKLKRWEHSQWPVMKNRAVKKAKRRNVGFEVSASCSFDVFLMWFPFPEYAYSKALLMHVEDGTEMSMGRSRPDLGICSVTWA